MVRKICVIDAPSVLGLIPEGKGVARLPEVLKSHGLIERIKATCGGIVSPDKYPYSAEPDETGVLNGNSIRRYSIDLADKLTSSFNPNQFLLVLGGDCSIANGGALFMSREFENPGIIWIDGHSDYYQISESPKREVADMALGIITGSEPDALSNIEDRKPYIQQPNAVLLGYRDQAEVKKDGGRNIVATSNISCISLDMLRDIGTTRSALLAIKRTGIPKDRKFWAHLDLDILDIDCVNYRLPGGLSFSELEEILKVIILEPRCVGMNLTIYNPDLDKDRSVGKKITDTLVEAFIYSP